MARKSTAEYEAARTTTVVGLRMSEVDAALLDDRASAAGVGKAEYVVRLMRSRSVPERDIRDLGSLAAATAAVYALSRELGKARNTLAEGFGLMKRVFISAPDVAVRSKAELDDACSVAKAVIREAEGVIARVERAATVPLAELELASAAIRDGG